VPTARTDDGRTLSWREAVLVAPGDDIAPVAEAFEASGSNADATKHFDERVAAGMGLRGHLARISAPTLVMFGERDPFGGPTSDEIAAALPDPTVVTVPGADHFPFLEPAHRAPWARAVLDFLAH
jgi:pimeloyl-ACP methyl ester carboxylesterase